MHRTRLNGFFFFYSIQLSLNSVHGVLETVWVCAHNSSKTSKFKLQNKRHWVVNLILLKIFSRRYLCPKSGLHPLSRTMENHHCLPINCFQVEETDPRSRLLYLLEIENGRLSLFMNIIQHWHQAKITMFGPYFKE